MKSIIMVGAGNLATQLGLALVEVGFPIVQVFSRTKESAQDLADKLNSEAITDINSLRNDADVYIFSVKDSVLCQLIPNVCRGKKDRLFLHTAGSMPLDCFKGFANRYGVFYPMQTFSKSRKVNFKEIPIFIEGSTNDTVQEIRDIASSISDYVISLSTNDRQYLHLAAVWACNFVNYCYSVAANILESKDIPFNVIIPLINETTQKVHDINPKDAQTGPAVRWDKNIIEKQMNLMSSFPSKQAIYGMISKDIHEQNKQ